jgi:hypothetical protein
MEEHLMNLLDWWENHQYDEMYPGKNMYTEDPKMVVTAKALWVAFYNGNPNEWTWLND